MAAVESLEPRLQAILALVVDMVKFAEAKNAGILAVNGGATVGILALFHSDKAPTGGAWWYLAMVCFGCLSSAFAALVSLVPNTHLPWLKHHAPRAGSSKVFFGHVQHYSASRYLADLSVAVDTQRASFLPLELDYAGQIIRNAQIASRKFTYFRYAIWLTLAGLISPLGAGLLYWWLAESEASRDAGVTRPAE